MSKEMMNYYLGVIGDRRGLAPAVLRIILDVLSCAYSVCVRLRLLLYRLKVLKRTKLSCSVISVGNITAGGTGKTPTVIRIAETVRGMGRKVAVLSRGYGGNRKSSEVSVVSDYDKVLLSPEEAGDEPYLLAGKLKGVPVIVSGNRVKSGSYAIRNFNTEVLLLDDGFQYLRLERDLDIMVIDCMSPFSNMKQLPGGFLREPLSHLKRADVFLLTRSNQAPGERKKFVYDFLASAGKKPVVESVHEPLALYRVTDNKKEELSFIKGRDVSVVSGIGNPQSFEETVKGLGANITGKFIFPDHHDYTEEDINRINAGKGLIITTEKDGVRLAGRVDDDVWALKVVLRIVSENRLWEEKIKNCLS